MSVARGDGRLGRVDQRSVARRTGALVRMASSGIDLLSGVSRDLQRAARVRAAGEGTTLRAVLLKALTEYAAGSWTPRQDRELRAAR